MRTDKTTTAICWLAGFALTLALAAIGAEEDGPLWAYPADLSPGPSVPPDESLRRVPNSDRAFTLSQTEDNHDVADWHPNNHPPAPPVVMRGHGDDLEACAHCHLPNGMGWHMLQAPALAGLPVSYIMEQVRDFKSGARRSFNNYNAGRTMQFVVKSADEADLQIAAEYFATLKARPWIRVVESTTVPRTKVVQMMYVPIPAGGTEPLGKRIVELPEDLARTELRDSESGYVAYVPPGSIKRGEQLVTTGGNNKTLPCGICHGPDLRGLGAVPAIAGRSPTYIARQLYDIQRGTRAGSGSALMKQVVVHLSNDDMVAIAAYAASRNP